MRQILKRILLGAAILFGPHTADADVTAFVDANVVTMGTERVLGHQTLVVTDGVISALGPNDEVQVPPDAQVIEASGRYLMPGLADMHMHLEITNAYNDPEQLLLFLAQGSTTVRILGAAPAALGWRDTVAAGELVGPTILAMAPTIVGNYDNSIGLKPVMLGLNLIRLLLPVIVGLTVLVAFKRTRARRPMLLGGSACLLLGVGLVFAETPPLNLFNPIFDAPESHVVEDRTGPVEDAIAQYRADGFDGVKLYDGLTEAQFLAGASASAAQGLYSTGHLLGHVPLAVQLASGLREVAHVDEFLSHHWIGYNFGRASDPAHAEKRDYPIDRDAIAQTVQLVAENDVAVVSNMSTDEALYRLLLDLEGTLAAPEFSAYRQDIVQGWKTHGRHHTAFSGQGPYRKNEIQPFLADLTKAFHDADVLILVGTDAGTFQPEGSIPQDIHRELELLVEAGFSTYEALAAGTKNAGDVVALMGRGDNVGTLAIGQKADLLLLRANPLENVSATRQRDGVMANGVWFEQSALDAMVQAYVGSKEW